MVVAEKRLIRCFHRKLITFIIMAFFASVVNRIHKSFSPHTVLLYPEQKRKKIAWHCQDMAHIQTRCVLNYFDYDLSLITVEDSRWILMKYHLNTYKDLYYLLQRYYQRFPERKIVRHFLFTILSLINHNLSGVRLEYSHVINCDNFMHAKKNIEKNTWLNFVNSYYFDAWTWLIP